ncbi:2,4-dienoyl-CoA reductase (NADPH2) [Desulfatibacillum alkenivorans DSM 16219]|uniref:2,4-dienoyl-CoA reductase (NADPH2) n=1 Tax=Desulfatibacillum alkenivorans DSM 16219 TaxID=1121393 RepID=A0A1M6EDW8_9BACT|nr:FAD-dependent oxidoreductase [Desulfatibacillum alkenivorans]SHI83676.1 2,4-dienoyl-CoA reductase (NADPH2) [Desulfatibacillum alkenivorans DSM 16219]
MYDYLFSPIKINKVEIKNRIAYPALGVLYSYDGCLNDRYYNFFRERAAGGAGLVTVGPVGVDFIGSGFIVLSLASDEAVPAFTKLADVIHEAGAKAWVQLFHAGRYAHPIAINNEQPLGVSPVFSPYSKATPKEMTLDELAGIQKAFVDAGVRAKKAGFDGVEIIGSAGYLITQFLSPTTNLRTDQYGGSFENRVRFPREVIEKLRHAVGPDFPVTIRMAGNDFIPGANTDVDMPAIAQVYEKAGIDAINVTGGWHETKVPQLPMDLPRGAFAFLAANVKKAVNVPIMASNRISEPALAEKIIRDNCADMVNLGRVLIADPEWPMKAQAGREKEIRPCVACNQGCTDQVFSGQPVFCALNARASYEGERILKKTGSPKKVMVIGAGPGGLEAAVTAAMAGHKVALYEKSDDIGGQLWLAGAPPHKHELFEIIRYYRAMLESLEIDLHLNTEVDAELIKAAAPEYIIVAEGAEPLIPPIDGKDDPCVLNAWDVLKNDPPLGPEVAVVGGGAVGLETAMFAAEKGTLSPEAVHFLMAYDAVPPERIKKFMFEGSSKVTVFEMLDKSGKDVGRSTKWVLMDNTQRFGINILTSAKVLSVAGGLVKFEVDGKALEKQFDNVIMAVGSRSAKTVSNMVEELDIPYAVIGDGAAPGKIDGAVHGGFLAAINI